MAGPPFRSIDTPIPYAQWLQTKSLFADGTKNTRTKVYDHPTLPDMRVAFGVTNLVEFWFFIVMAAAEEV